MFDREQVEIQRADALLDAEQGQQLMKILRNKWRAQGSAAYFDGVALNDTEVVWSLDHRVGWRQAQVEAMKQ